MSGIGASACKLIGTLDIRREPNIVLCSGARPGCVSEDIWCEDGSKPADQCYENEAACLAENDNCFDHAAAGGWERGTNDYEFDCGKWSGAESDGGCIINGKEYTGYPGAGMRPPKEQCTSEGRLARCYACTKGRIDLIIQNWICREAEEANWCNYEK